VDHQGGRVTTLGVGMVISGGGTLDIGGGMPFRPVPAEFNHWDCITSQGVARNLFWGGIKFWGEI